jgi:hypothetical protein
VALGRALRLYAGSHGDQWRILTRLAAELAPSAVVVARIGGAREAEALRQLAMEGVQVVAALPCANLRACAAWPPCYPLLHTNPRTGRAVRAHPPATSAIVEVSAQGALAVYADADAALGQALAGRWPQPDRHGPAHQAAGGGAGAPDAAP